MDPTEPQETFGVQTEFPGWQVEAIQVANGDMTLPWQPQHTGANTGGRCGLCEHVGCKGQVVGEPRAIANKRA